MNLKKIFRDSSEVFDFSFFCGVTGIIFLDIFIRFNFGNLDDQLISMRKKFLFDFYALSWCIFPILAIGVAGILKKIKVVLSPDEKNAFFFPVLNFWNFLWLAYLLNLKATTSDRYLIYFYFGVLMVAVCSFKLIQLQSINFLKSKEFYYFSILLISMVWFFRLNAADLNPKGWDGQNIVLFVFVLFSFYWGGSSFLERKIKFLNPASINGINLVKTGLAYTAIFALIRFFVFDDNYRHKIVLLACVLLYFGVNSFLKGGILFFPKKKYLLSIAKVSLPYIVAFLLIFFLVFNISFSYSGNDYGYFLGPTADLQGGKSLLFNINSLYGVLIFYFLKTCFIFLPLGFTSFSLFVLFLEMVQYFIFYFIVRRIFVGEVMPLFSLLMLIFINNYGGFGDVYMSPSTGPLRFGFVYILMALILLRNRYPARKNIFLLLESFVIAAAFFWSVEVCVYTLPAYIVFAVYESIKIGKKIDFDVKLLVKRVLMILFFIFMIGSYIYFDVFLRTHSYPHWSYYFDYVLFFRNGYGMMPIPETGFWWLIIGVLYISVFSIFGMFLNVCRTQKTLPQELNAIVYLTLSGITQFYYYLGRSNWNNLFHVSMPSILLAIYWLYCLRRINPGVVPIALKRFGFGLMVVLSGFYIQLIWPNVKEHIDVDFSLPTIINKIELACHDIPRNDSYAKRVLKLMEKYSGDKKRLVYFLGDEDLNITLYDHHYNVYPYNYVIQAGFCPPALNRILAFDPNLKVGDYVYYDTYLMKSPEYSNPQYLFEDELFSKFITRYKLKVVETDQTLVVAQVQKVMEP